MNLSAPIVLLILFLMAIVRPLESCVDISCGLRHFEVQLEFGGSISGLIPGNLHSLLPPSLSLLMCVSLHRLDSILRNNSGEKVTKKILKSKDQSFTQTQNPLSVPPACICVCSSDESDIPIIRQKDLRKLTMIDTNAPSFLLKHVLSVQTPTLKVEGSSYKNTPSERRCTR